MNYELIYNNLIENAQQNHGYQERHHIIPRCLGGSDDPNNLVYLSAREHYLAHWLLYKIHRTSKLVHAWHAMSRCGDGQLRDVNSHLFKYCKENRQRHMKNDMKGENNPFYGKKHTDKTKEIISSKNSGRKASQETKNKMSKTRKGVPKSKEHRAKIGRKGLVALWEDSISPRVVRVDKQTAEQYKTLGWMNVSQWKKKYKPELWTCPHCGKSGSGNANGSRWHFDKCKMKDKNEN